MLLFDSDLLCVDGLIDADSLRRGGKEGQRRETENTNQPTAFFTPLRERKKKPIKTFKCQVFHFRTWHPSTFQKVAFSFPSHLGNGRQQGF